MMPVISSALLSSGIGRELDGFVRGEKAGLAGARGDLGEAVPERMVSARSRAFCREQQEDIVSSDYCWSKAGDD